nr:hypothetical protein [Streptomyces yerevanensis]
MPPAEHTAPQTPGGYAASPDFAGQPTPQGSGRHGAPQASAEPDASQAPGNPGGPQAQGGAAGSPTFAGHSAPQGSGRHGAPQGPTGPAAPQAQGGYAAPQRVGDPAASRTPAAYDGPSQPSAGHAAPLPAQSQPSGPGRHSAPLPPAAGGDEGATQYLPPVPTGASGAPGDEGATQYIPPVSPGALPPEAPAPSDAEATRFLGRVRQGGPGPMPAAGATAAGAGAGPLPPAADPNAEATQYIAPIPAQPQPTGAAYGIRPGAPDDRQPPAEFDNLFRETSDGPDATQQLPQFDLQSAPGGRAARRERGAAADSGHGNGGGKSSRGRIPLIAAVGVGIAVLGIGAGALLSGSGGDDSGDENKTVADTAPTAEESPSASASADPAKAQAVALDKLLADSNDSRDAVIRAVSNVRACTNLGQAATDLRNAAEQRNGLVTRLASLPVDKLPNHAQLTAALNSAWKASASADTHYATWADQVAAKKGCPKGQARTTPQTRAGNRESGTATTQKAKAAPLWNAIAQTYGLTERQPTQL